MSKVEIDVRELVKTFTMGNLIVHALRGLNLQVRKGEIISIIGPSGSGKTTLLNIVGGLDSATFGSVTVAGIELTSLSRSQLVDFRRKNVGHIFQKRNLVSSFSAFENVELPMIALGVPMRIRERRVEMLLNTVRLSNKRDHKPDELSGGEQQRVAVAAALANDPPILLADEPTGELDTSTAKVVTDFLVQVNKEFGTTIIMVTHDPNVARAADRVLVICDGIIREEHESPPSDLRLLGVDDIVYNLRNLLRDLEERIDSLDEDFKSGKVSGDEYVDDRLMIKQTKEYVIKELRKRGVY